MYLKSICCICFLKWFYGFMRFCAKEVKKWFIYKAFATLTFI